MHYSLTRATTWNLFGYIYLLIASLVSIPLLIRGLGTAQFAAYGLLIATISLLSAFDLGLPQAVTRALTLRKQSIKQRDTTWATSSLLFALSGVGAGLISVAITWYLGFSSTIQLTTLAIVVMNNIVSHYLTLASSNGHFGYYNSKTFIVGTMTTLGAAYLSMQGYGITGLLAGQLTSYLITHIVLASYARRFFPRPWEYKSSGVVARSLMSFGLKNQAGKIIGQVQGQYAKYLLTAVSPLRLSSYLIAVGLVQKAAGAVQQVALALYPAMARGYRDPHMRTLYIRLQIALALAGSLSIWIYPYIAYPLLLWWLQDPRITEVVYAILQVLVWYLAILVLTPLPSLILDASGRPGITSLFAFVTAIIEIGLAIVLMPRYEYLAPAYAALIALILTTPALLYVTARISRAVPQAKPIRNPAKWGKITP